MENLGNQILRSEIACEGFSRNTFLKYFLFLVAMTALFGIMLVNTGGKHLNEILVLAFALILPISFWAVAQRLKNIRIHRMWCILILVPVINLFVVSGCLICPERYWETKKLDSTGKITAGIIVVLTIVLLVVGITSLARG
ncbi:MAG: hypothetical protein PHT96_13455 [Syntrophorhabdaceae bacterium]|nr:hypothetical protein [Syntrophorhabdaceae bacterium]MDD4197390.1 hypothetical protein [Syntrophorhabdaceae bacterium]